MTALVADAACQLHDTGHGHPESPARFSAVMDGLKRAGLLEKRTRLQPRAVTGDDLALAHEIDYLRRAERDILSGAAQLSTGDTSVCEASWEAARLAVGCALAAVDAVIEGKADNAFCAVRPPGHHATADRGMGFCVLNNVALAARHAQRRHGIERVLIVDWDVHHGNGTQDIFYEDGSVFFFSTHQSPWYPGTGHAKETGAGAGKGATLNCPLPAGAGRTEIFAAFEEQLLPAMEKFRPEFVLISAGFDSRAGDPLGDFLLTDADFADLTQLVRGIADRHAKGRVVSLLEGGYGLGGLASAAAAHVAALLK
ncbi:MAG: histone deacetylase [Chthoniobacter sp.]|uniref:histone deacetylase family protein n=1 Tax=Chthoniobacter sp. TaxID=2510640 RepID=UPI0032A65BB6